MPAFPLFIELKEEKCLVVGGGKVAARKIKILIEFGAAVHVISPEITEEIRQLYLQGALIYHQRAYSENYLDGAFLVIAATSDEAVNHKVAADAQTRQIFVNVADQPEQCTFYFPSVVRRGDLVVGITTTASYPALSKHVRKRVDSALADVDEHVTHILKQCRERALREIHSAEGRKELLHRILDEVIFSEEPSGSHSMNIKIEKIFGEYENEESS